jgi:hypothetical protein
MVSDGETFDLEVLKLDYLAQSLRGRVGRGGGGGITETLIGGESKELLVTANTQC